MGSALHEYSIHKRDDFRRKKKCGYQQISQGMTIPTKADGNIQGAEIDTRTGTPKSETGSRQSNRNYPVKCTIEYGRRPPKNSISGDTSSLPRPIKHPSQGCCCVPAGRSIECKHEPCTPRSPSRDPLCKCGKSPIKELEIEKDRRMRMEEEVNRLKLQIADMMQSKCMALNMTKQLKQRYEKMKGSHQDITAKLASLQRENEFLCRCLEKERQTGRDKTESSVQVTKDMDKHAIKKLKEQNARIRSLNDSVLSLTKTVEDKEFEKKRLEHEKDKIHEKLRKNKDVTKRLSETNAKLARSVRQKHDSFMAIRNKAGKYQKELSDYKNEVRRSQMELEKLKAEIEKQKSKGDSLMAQPAKGKDADGLEDKLKKTKDRERRASETIQLLSQRIRDLESKDPKSLEKELLRVNKEFKALQVKYDEILQKLKQYEEADAKRAEIIKDEMKSFTDDLAKREEAYLQEKAKLKELIDELQSIIEQQKRRIEELESTRQQQDLVIKSQSAQLVSKEEQIRLREKENDLVKEQCLDLDKQVDNLRTSIDQFQTIGAKATHIELRERIKYLSDEVDGLKSDLKEEQQKSNTKDKVIEDQYNTIKDLKKQLGQKDRDLISLSKESSIRAKASQEQVERMGRQLAKEKEITRQTVSNLMSMQKKKKKLERDVEDLEEAYEEFSSISFLERLEKEQKQWDEEKKLLMEERNRAIDAAKLATKTLMETMDDFQGQIKSQQKLQKIVTEIISSKSERNLPPCMRRRETERKREMQIAIPCKPVVPSCNLHSCISRNEENGFYTASSGKYSGFSDSEDSSETTPGIFNLLGQYSNYFASLPRPGMPTMTRKNICTPQIARPISAPSEPDCRCINAQNLQCQCSQKSAIPLPLSEQSRQTMTKGCYCKTRHQSR